MLIERNKRERNYKNMDYKSINDEVIYVTTPYKDIYTTVFLIKTDKGYMIFDSASFDCDIDDTIKPLIEELKIDANELKYVFISHAHADHAGGLKRLLEVYPNLTVITKNKSLCEKYSSFNCHIPEDEEIFLEVLKVVYIPGHSACSQAILDTRTNSLFSGDCLQLYGIFGSGNWAANISLIPEHLEALERLENMDIDAIYTAHDYHPLGQFYIGKEKITEAFKYCREPLYKIAKMIKAAPEKSNAAIAADYNATKSLPKLSEGIVGKVREAKL